MGSYLYKFKHDPYMFCHEHLSWNRSSWSLWNLFRMYANYSSNVVNPWPHVAGQHQKTSEQSNEHDGPGGNHWLRRREGRPGPSLQATTSHRWSSSRPWFARCCWPPNCFLSNGPPKYVCAILATRTWPTHTCEMRWERTNQSFGLWRRSFIVFGHDYMDGPWGIHESTHILNYVGF